MASDFIQFDHSARIVSTDNLEAMCERLSGVCHRYWVEKVTKRFAHVTYSNPDEYANEHPMTATLPVIPFGNDHVAIVLSIHNVKPDPWDGEGWQAFQPLFDCPRLWKDPESKEWIPEKLKETAARTKGTN